jgi:cytoskeletal protein RodZ
MSSENSKPEWFQMTETDVFPPRSKGKRAVRIMALATPLLVLGAGLVFAQTQDSPTAVASAVTSTATPTADPIALSTTPSQSVVSAPASTPVTTQASTPTSRTIQVSQSSSTTQSPSITIKKPAIATLPTGGGDDERSSDDD